MAKTYPSLLLLFVLSIFSCKKEEGIDYLSTTPRIEFISVNKTDIVEFEDSVIVILKYEDGDGDLGRPHPDDNSLSVKDSRLNKAELYHLPPIIPEGENLQTTGTIRVFVPTLFVIGSSNEEDVTLSLRVKDQAGNWSNDVQTPLIKVRKNEEN